MGDIVQLDIKNGLRRTGKMDALMMLLVIALICMLFILSFSSVAKQIDSSKSRLLAEAVQFETGLGDVLAPLQGLSLALTNGLESADPADPSVIGRVRYDADKGYSYLAGDTDAFRGTLFAPFDLRSASDSIRAEAARAVEIIGRLETEDGRYCYYISRSGFAVYGSLIAESAFLDGDGAFTATAAWYTQATELAAALPAAKFPAESVGDTQAVAISRPYQSAPADTAAACLAPVTADGWTVGAVGCDVTLADLDAMLGRVSSELGTLYLLHDTDGVLAGRADGESLYADGGIGESALEQFASLRLSRAELDALDADPDAVVWRGTRMVFSAPVRYAGIRILYVGGLFALLSESNLLLWFGLCAAAMAVIVVLFSTLMKSRREILLNNLRLQEDVEKLDDQSHYDKLTGLLTAESIIDMIDRFIKLTPVTVLMLDIDHFKQINDNFLHTFGNTVLKRVASIIREQMPRNAYAGRFGGDEFVCMLIDPNPKQACVIAGEIRAAVEALRFREHETAVTVSIGIALSWNKVAKDVLDKADAMLYKAKESGRNRWVYEEE
jgi:diguanylate cyclase (GGDEF)-like protein